MGELVHGVVTACRSLRRTPAFTLVAIVSLTLAVAANTAAFTLLNALLWRDVDVRDPGTLVQLATVDRNGDEHGLSWPALQDLRRRDDVFSATLGWFPHAVVDAETGFGTVAVGLQAVTGDFYAELGAVPTAGRLLTPADVDVEHDQANAVAVIGWSFWQRVYGGSADAIGRDIRLEGVPLTIVGVAPRGFKGLGVVQEPDVIVPLGIAPRIVGGEAPMKQGGSPWIQVMGRLRPGVTLDRARVQLVASWPALLERTMPPGFVGAQRDAFLAKRLLVRSGARGVEILLRPYYTRPLMALLAIAAIVALITAVNLGALAYARTGARAYELGLRRALGASRGRLARDATIEGVTLGAVAATASVPLAAAVCTAAARLILEEALVPLELDVAPDVRVMAVASGLAVGIGVLITLVPVWTTARHSSEPDLRRSGRTATGPRRAGHVLLTAQVALSVVLLVGAGLLVHSLQRITSTTTGLAAGVLVGYPSPNGGAYRGVDPETYYRSTLNRIAAVPGVQGAAFALFKPAGGAPSPEPMARARTSPDAGADLMALPAEVSPGFFATLGMDVIQGRDFSWDDNGRGRRVVILSRSLAARLFGPGGGIGEHVRLGVRANMQDLEVVGVVSDARVHDVRRQTLFTAYVPSLQLGENANWKAVVLRAPASAVPAVRQVFDAIGVESLRRVASLEYITSRTVLTERLMGMLAACFGAFTLALAAIGIHGQMAYTVSLQRKEIGVRMALGAGGGRIVAWIVGSGLAIGAAGGLLGLLAAVPLAGVLRGLLVGTSPYDPLAFAGAPLVLLAAIAAACLVPAFRAAAVNPIDELRRD